VAEKLGLHRTVARAHLEKLCVLGLVSARSHPRREGGRPVRSYAVVDTRLEVTLPPRHYERLARLLLALVLDCLDAESATAQATAVGRACGEHEAVALVASDVVGPVKLSVSALAEWMRRSGYEMTASTDGSLAVIQVRNCVYRELSVQNRELVCAFDRGLLCGMLDVDLPSHTQTHALSAGDPYCRHEFRL
jgi:predicted ArsR family transcriptional regulator